MSEIYVDPTSSTTASGSKEQPFRRLSSINPIAKAGDTIHLADGDYADAFAPINSGTPEQYIKLFSANDAVLPKGARLAGRSYIAIDGVDFHSLGASWLIDSSSSHHITVRDCHLDSKYNGVAFAFVGMLLNGSDHTIVDNIFGDWLGGDAVQIWGDCNRFDSDMSKCRSPHGHIMCYGNGNKVGGTPDKPMVISNPWGRAGEVYGIDPGKGVGNEFAYIHAIDCGWDGQPLPTGAWSEGGKRQWGSGQIFKVGGQQTSFHDIKITGSSNFGVEDLPYAACIQLSNFVFGGASNPRPVTVARDINMHNLTIEDNALHALSVTRNDSLPFDFANVRLHDSLLQRNNWGLWLAQDGPWLDELFIDNNIIGDMIVRGPKTFTIGEYERAYPVCASGNRDGVVVEEPPVIVEPMPTVPKVINITIEVTGDATVTVNGVRVEG